MNRLRPAVTLLLLAAPVAACSAHWNTDDDGKPGIAAAGTGGERHWTVSGFDAIDIGGAGDVQVHVGPAFSLTATGSPDLLDKVKITQDGHTLDIGRRSGDGWGDGGKLHFVVTMPAITGAGIGGSGTIAIDRVEGKAFEGNIGGSGKLDVAAMKVGKASFNVGGSGDIAAAGTTQALSVSIGGSGSIKATPLSAQTADISIAGAGKIAATVTQTAAVTIMGSGDVTITGGAKCSVTKMGAGAVHYG
ncbi:head GIN domain-containing protein [uncultured Sphingomonas sp.]|uniref:head GIN domain-containing protein n=1 Tax=uncultured Sphingomonas sp. TaxID=158754 RepID=UPI0035CB37E0